MCTSIVVNKSKPIVGWNLDIIDMQHRIRTSENGVYIEINDPVEGWLPLFGANKRGDFVGMPTCHPFDERSNPASGDEPNIIMLDIDLLTMKKTLDEIKEIADTKRICSVRNVTFMSSLSDKDGNVLHIIPGQGAEYYEKPEYKILTNFSPYKQDSVTHPWMGLDRYHKAEDAIKACGDSFDVKDCFNVLKEASQEVCPTVVSMVFDVDEKTVYWCEDRKWDDVKTYSFVTDHEEIER